MLISPKYCKVQSYDDVGEDNDNDDDDDDDDEDDDDSNNSHVFFFFFFFSSSFFLLLFFSHYDIGSSNDEDLGIHVVGQRLRLGTPSTPPSSKSDNQTISQSVYKVRFENILFIIVISTTWYFWSSVNQSV